MSKLLVDRELLKGALAVIEQYAPFPTAAGSGLHAILTQQGNSEAVPPAQTEQQPVSWQFYQNGKWWNGDDRIKDHRKNTEAAGIPVRDLYAAPIEQTVPQPEQSGLVMPVALTSVSTEYDRGWSDHAAEVLRLNAALSAQGGE